MAKSLKRTMVATLLFALMFMYYVPAKAAMLYNAQVTLDNPLAAASTSYAFAMKVKTGGAGTTIKGIKMQFLRTADPGSGAPSSITYPGGGNASGLTGLTGNWALDVSNAGTDTYFITKAAGDAPNANADIAWTIGGITNPGISNDANGTGCARRVDTGVPNITDANNSAGTCYVRIVTYSSDTVATIQGEDPSGAAGTYPDVIDYTTIAFTVTTEVTMKATVDSSMAFTVVGLPAATDVADAGATGVTSDPSTYNTLDFKNITVGIPKTMAQKLYVKTNAMNGYSVKVKSTTDSGGGNVDANGVLKGQYAGNNIDGFGADLGGGAASWTTPKAWAHPVSATPNVDTGYLGVNSNDTHTVFNGAAAQLWAPLMNSAPQEIMKNTTPDLGGEAESHIITYAIEANVYLSADQYTGTFFYQATPMY